jgi:hypothetical protein
MKKKFISKFFSFFTGVVDTTDKHSFANISANFQKHSKFEIQSLGVKSTKLSSQQNMKKNFISKFFSFFTGVVDTTDKHSFVNISANFRKNSKWS